MRIQKFLEHHGIRSNPFADEDAQTDQVFKEHCISSTYHPSWDKIYGDPGVPATSIVFGEKGAGKTALRLQVTEQLAEHNRKHPEKRAFVVQYDDFNPYLDHFAERFRRGKRPEKVLADWKLWDHMDAILALSVTQVVDQVLGTSHTTAAAGPGQPDEVAAGAHQKLDASKLDRLQSRDLLLLAACYDQSTAETIQGRWHRLRKKLRFFTLKSQWDFALGIALTLAVLALSYFGGFWQTWLRLIWPFVLVIGGCWGLWLYRCWKRFWLARGIRKNVRVLNRELGPLRRILMQFSNDELAGQPVPNKQRTDDRYELLAKLQAVLRTLGYPGVIVLVDRVDEPDLVGGSSQRMKALLWPMLDNKFLKHPGIGFKLLLPVELSHYVDREGPEFYQRARLDKQNLIRSLEWTGEALYDVANARLQACAAEGKNVTLRQLFDDSISDARLIDTLRTMRVPRHLFKFMHQLFVAHSNAHTEDEPAWQIRPEVFESTLALFRREQETYDRGMHVA